MLPLVTTIHPLIRVLADTDKVNLYSQLSPMPLTVTSSAATSPQRYSLPTVRPPNREVSRHGNELGGQCNYKGFVTSWGVGGV